ncbi:hypothetical protein SAMN05444266_10478 [Chitinophaga jiangningensis]|uniref:Uncharacterized protein n=1 Tax=Chitinophaga jiangningensis TaxID=1419482 RepID=A0A1M7BUL6_9BACT|nr:hypothetical protein [Chitinophaga jiangningensis]SHL58680.1 hypothetical protein SAMN05444266_10478 [Chitinophaga jiangningensis]
MKKAKIILLITGLLVTVSVAIANKARGISTFYAPTIHGGPCYITTYLFLTTTDYTLGDAYEIARQETIDSCAEFCVGYE